MKLLSAVLILLLAWHSSAVELRSFDLVFRTLAEKPIGPGFPAIERNAWNMLASFKDFREVINRAQTAVKKNYRMPPDSLFLHYYRTGDRITYEREMSTRRSDLRYLALAECLEYRGHYLLQLENMIRSFCELKTWVMPYNDPHKAIYSGQVMEIDPNAALLAWDLAVVLWLHEAKLNPEVRFLLRDNLNRRVLFPFRDMVNGKRPHSLWLLSDHNNNPVCLSGIAGTAMIAVNPRKERAFYVAACIDASRGFVNGFPPDGYCRGGLPSWSYGFGHYLLFGEMVLRGTAGGVNLMNDRKAVPFAMFPDQVRIAPGVYPDFAGMEMAFPGGDFWLGLRDRLMLHPSVNWQDIRPQPLYMSLPQTLMAAFLTKPRTNAVLKKGGDPLPPDSYFPSGGLLICRPGGNSACRLAVAVKADSGGGANGYGNSGAYILTLDGLPLLVDPCRRSRPTDTRLTHPVPLVNGLRSLPAAAINAAPELTAEQDRWTINLMPAYRLDGMVALERKITYSRKKNGALTVVDAGRFRKQVSFETVLVTPGQFTLLEYDSFIIEYKGKKLRGRIDVPDSDFEVLNEPLREYIPVPGTMRRITVRLRDKTVKPSIKITFTPYEENKRDVL